MEALLKKILAELKDIQRERLQERRANEKLLKAILARLGSIQQDIRDLPRIQAAHIFLAEEEVRGAQLRGLQASDIYESTDGNLSRNTHDPSVSGSPSTEG